MMWNAPKMMPKQPSITAMLLVLSWAFPAAARAQGAGEGLFRQRCASCHVLQPGQNRIGPHLTGLGGRTAGSVEGARYSAAMRSSGLVWDEPTLDRYLANPREVVPGTTMVIAVPNEDQRREIVAYLLAPR